MGVMRAIHEKKTVPFPSSGRFPPTGEAHWAKHPYVATFI